MRALRSPFSWPISPGAQQFGVDNSVLETGRRTNDDHPFHGAQTPHTIERSRPAHLGLPLPSSAHDIHRPHRSPRQPGRTHRLDHRRASRVPRVLASAGITLVIGAMGASASMTVVASQARLRFAGSHGPRLGLGLRLEGNTQLGTATPILCRYGLKGAIQTVACTLPPQTSSIGSAVPTSSSDDRHVCD